MGRTSTRRRGLAALGTAALAAAALAPVAQADSLNGRIAFTSFRVNGSGDIFTMNPDGSDQRALTTHPAYDAQSDWSPDGLDIAFRSQASGVFETWRMDRYGGGLRQLTVSPPRQSSTQPAWLPDKSGVLFRRAGGGLDAEIWRMGAEGEDPHKVAPIPLDQWYPSLSPDGRTLLFSTTTARRPKEDRGIYAADADGSNVRLLYDVPGSYDSAPNWSPNGSRIAFESDVDGDMEVYVMNADGSGVAKLTDNTAHDEGPTWSPDGLKIAFTSGPDNLTTDVHAMNADGTGVRRLTVTEGRDESPDWQPVPHPGAQVACGDVVAEGPGAYSVRASGHVRCEKALRIAERWSRDALAGPEDEQEDEEEEEAEHGRHEHDDEGHRGFVCATEDTGYGALKVVCMRQAKRRHRPEAAEVVFIHRAG